MIRIFLATFPSCALFVWWLVETEARRVRLEQIRRRILEGIEVSRV